jgi:hypothetical protein
MSTASATILGLIYGAFRACELHNSSHLKLHACCPPSALRLLIVVIAILIDHVEESQLIDTLACRDNP